MTQRDQFKPWLSKDSQTTVTQALDGPKNGQLEKLTNQRIAEYQDAKKLETLDPKKGANIFQVNCSACHRIKPQGGLIGPQLDGIDTGAFITVPTIHPSNVPTGYIAYNLPADWPPGKYLVRFRVARAENAPEERRFLEFGLRVRNVDLLSVHEVTGTLQNPQIIETTIEITRTHMMGGNGDESSPVERGVWVLRKLLHQPPPRPGQHPGNLTAFQ